jgi:hypothetical protein
MKHGRSAIAAVAGSRLPRMMTVKLGPLCQAHPQKTA